MIFHARPPCADSLAAHSLRSGGTVWTYPLAGNHSYYFMLTERFWHWMGPKQGWSEPDDAGPATIDIGLAFSTVRSCVIVAGIWAAVSKGSSHNLARQDGVRFTHLGEREAFIGLGREGSFDSRMVWGIPSPVVMEEHGEIWFYFSGMSPGASLHARLRLTPGLRPSLTVVLVTSRCQPRPLWPTGPECAEPQCNGGCGLHPCPSGLGALPAWWRTTAGGAQSDPSHQTVDFNDFECGWLS